MVSPFHKIKGGHRKKPVTNIFQKKSKQPSILMKELRLKEREIKQKAQEREELNKTIEEDTKIAEDENEQPSVRDQARERVAENTQREAQLEQEQNQLEQEREQLEERLPLRERVKNIFKKYGWTTAGCCSSCRHCSQRFLPLPV